jgi:hypothetical protein
VWEIPSSQVSLLFVTVERPGTAYTLGDAMVHQSVMEPDTVTLFVRGRVARNSPMPLKSSCRRRRHGRWRLSPVMNPRNRVRQRSMSN